MCLAGPAAAQSLTTELDVTAGVSSEAIGAGGVQARAFGPVGRDWRVYLEGSWATRSAAASDVFGSAFPYDRRVQPMEMYAERLFRPRGYLVGVRAGRYRTPFGISGRSDHGYTGFVRPPLMRYGGNFALSNTAMETGLDLLVGTPAFSVETSVGVPSDAGHDRRPRTLDAVVRAQGYHGSFIIGASYLSTRAHPAGPWVNGRTSFGGVDVRWMRGGIQLRGEWLFGRSFDGVSTQGGYLDGIVHRPGMGPVTAVARVEQLDYDAGPFSTFVRRFTIGGRLRLPFTLGAQVNLVRQHPDLSNARATALDFSLTKTVRF
jgi:hypothetical protein